MLRYVIGKRLKRGRLTVVDATNVQPEDRKKLVALAREWHCLPVAVVLDMPKKVIESRHDQRDDRDFGMHVIRRQLGQFRRNIRGLKREGFRIIHTLKSVEEVEQVVFERQRLWNNKKDLHGPFDIIGDVHGCLNELLQLLVKLGYELQSDATYAHSEGRTAVFVGDLVDRGPANIGVLELALNMCQAGSAICVPGNHDVKFLKWLQGRKVMVRHGLERTIAEVESLPDEVRREKTELWIKFLDGLVSHFVLDDGKLVVAHAGMKEAYQGRGSGQVRDFALYGETDGEIDEYGLPVRHDWAAEYRGRASVVYGHTPVPEAEWLNNTICLDTGCVFGGKLTALRYPERDLVSVEAAEVYSEPIRPLVPETVTPTISAQASSDDLLDLEDVSGKRHIQTRLRKTVNIGAEHAAAALEVMSRFAVNPKWLVYLPPTMSPCATHPEGEFLEHPAEAFEYYRSENISTVICEEKHMGSRAVVIVCRDVSVARRRFGVMTGERGMVVSRTGRRFFDPGPVEDAFLERLDQACEQAGIYEQLETDFLILDCELMPWSAKAKDLLRRQYAAVGAASEQALGDYIEALQSAQKRSVDVEDFLSQAKVSASMTKDFRAAYRRYCWQVESLDDYRLAPFHILASASGVHTDRDHQWHMETIAKLAECDKLFIATPYRIIDLHDEAAVQEGIEWWLQLTGNGGEGMVVKPVDFIVTGKRGIIQPAVKCRGREYLRIIYGPEYTEPHNLTRLRKRGLGHKRSLALREFALGIEALERFIAGDPLRKIHECVFGVMALESEPVDPDCSSTDLVTDPKPSGMSLGLHGRRDG